MEAEVPSPGGTILFFGRYSRNEGLPYHRARNIEFGLGGPFNWAGRPTQIEALRKIMQEGHYTIIEAVVEKKTKARGSRQPWGKTRHPKNPSAAYDIEEWIQGLEEVSDGELKWNNETDHRADQCSIHLQHWSQGQRRHGQQRAPSLPREPSGGSPTLGGNSLVGQSE